MNTVSYDLISFDLDGTLVDTASEIAEAANRALETHGVQRRPVAEISLLIGAGSRELMLKLWARCLIEDPSLADAVKTEDVLSSMDEHYAMTAGSSAVPYSGCRPMLVALRAAGVKLACVTNKEVRHARSVLKATRLDSCFDLLVGGDSLAVKKPHANVLRHVAEAMQVSLDRTAHLGDSSTDVEAARNAGVGAWAVPYGYNSGHSIEDSMPDRIFGDLVAVSNFVLASRKA